MDLEICTDFKQLEQCKHSADKITMFTPGPLLKTSSSIGTIFSPIVISHPLSFALSSKLMSLEVAFLARFFRRFRNLYFPAVAFSLWRRQNRGILLSS